MITIDLLKNHPDSISRCAEIWHEVLGKIWLPDISVERVVLRFTEHLNEDVLSITFNQSSFDSSAAHLQTDYIDSYVLHGPSLRSKASNC
jgi:hypothetical protein